MELLVWVEYTRGALWKHKSYKSLNLVFSGDKYWRFDDAVGRVELDYPRDISMWRGVPSDVDAAFQYIDGKTYYFKVVF